MQQNKQEQKQKNQTNKRGATKTGSVILYVCVSVCMSCWLKVLKSVVFYFFFTFVASEIKFCGAWPYICTYIHMTLAKSFQFSVIKPGNKRRLSNDGVGFYDCCKYFIGSFFLCLHSLKCMHAWFMQKFKKINLRDQERSKGTFGV